MAYLSCTLLSMLVAQAGVLAAPSTQSTQGIRDAQTAGAAAVAASNPSIIVLPAAGPPGTPAVISGSGFKPGDIAIISFADPLTPAIAITAMPIGADGSLPPTSVLIPSAGAPGALAVIVARDIPSVSTTEAPLVASAIFGITPFTGQLSPSAGDAHPGDQLQVSGAGFGPSRVVTLSLIDAAGIRTPLGSPATSTNSGALLPMAITIPDTAATGTGALEAIDAAGSVAAGPLIVQPPGSDTIAHLSSVFAVPGASVQIVAGGFQAGEPLQITLQDAASSTIVASDGLGIMADGTGQVSTSLAMPLNDLSVANPPSGRLQGTGGNAGSLLSVTVRGITSGVTRRAPLLVPATALLVAPAASRAGEPITITGRGYHAGEGITVTAIDTAGTIVQLGQSTAAANGSVSLTVPAPAEDSAFGATRYTISATGESSDLAASASFSTIHPPALSFSQYVLAPGQATDILGASFSASSPITVTVLATWSQADAGPVVLQTTTDVLGAFSVRLAVPHAAPVGPVSVQAVDGLGQRASGVLVLTDQPASIRLSGLAVMPGKSMMVTGSGFGSGETINLFLAPPSVQPLTSSAARATADALGRFTAVFVMPAEATGLGTAIGPGGYLLWARGLLSKRQAAHGVALVDTPGKPRPTPLPIATPDPAGCKASPNQAGPGASGAIAYFANGSTAVTAETGHGSVASVQEIHIANSGNLAATVTVQYLIMGTGSQPRLRRVTFGIPPHAAGIRSVNADTGLGQSFGIIVRTEVSDSCRSGTSCVAACTTGVRVTLITHRVLSETALRCAQERAGTPGVVICPARTSGTGMITRNLDAAATAGVTSPRGPALNWYFAEGNTGPAFAESINLFNPDTVAATARLLFLTPAGARAAANPIRLQPFAATTVDIRVAYLLALGCPGTVSPRTTERQSCRAARSGVSLGLTVHSSEPIVAARTMLWGVADGGIMAGFDVSPGVSTGMVAAHFAYGSTLNGDQGFLSIMNTAACAAPARCTAQVSVAAFANSGIRLANFSLVLLPGSRATVPLSRLAGNAVMSLSVRATLPVVAELAQYIGGPPTSAQRSGFDAQGSRGGTTLATGGFEAGTAPVVVRVFNPTSSRIWVHVTAWQGNGKPYTPSSYSVGGSASLEMVLPQARLAGSSSGAQSTGQPIAVTVACSGVCVAAGLEGARGATLSLPTMQIPESWTAALT